jgi:hypothetical protein
MDELEALGSRIESLATGTTALHIPFDDEVLADVRAGLVVKLFEMKRRIRERKMLESASFMVAEAEQFANEAKDEDVRAQVTNSLHQVRNTLHNFASERRVAAAEDVLLSRLRAHEDGIRRVELFERRWEVLRRLLVKDLMASAVGGVLVIALAIALIVGMFLSIEPSSIIANAFLLVLGYFFGQTVSAPRRRS